MKRSGVGQADISPVASGRANPTVSTLAAIARALGYGLALVPLKSPAADVGPRRIAGMAAKRRRRAPATA